MKSTLLCLSLLVGGCGGAFLDEELDLTSGETGDLAVTVTPHFGSLYGDYLSTCKQCHAPGAPGRTLDTEQSLDFTTRSTAYTTLTTKLAAGLVGNQLACNDVPFLVAGQPSQSLLVAVLDATVRQAFDRPAAPGCDVDAISDETVKVGSAPSAAFLAALSDWITAGALDDGECNREGRGQGALRSFLSKRE